MQWMGYPVCTFVTNVLIDLSLLDGCFPDSHIRALVWQKPVELEMADYETSSPWHMPQLPCGFFHLCHRVHSVLNLPSK